MSHEAVFIPCQPFTVGSATQRDTAKAMYANYDPVGRVWRTPDLSSCYAVIQFQGSIDSIALARTNLTPNASVSVTFASSPDMSNVTAQRTTLAWNGPAGTDGAYTYIGLESPLNNPWVRIDITDPTNPAGYVEVQRIVGGKRVECDGVDYGAEQSFEDDSTVDTSNGITTVDRYRVRTSWKFTVSAASDLTYARDWYPFLSTVGKQSSFLFIPDADSPYIQTQATLARINSTAKGSSPASDFWKLDLQLLAV